MNAGLVTLIMFLTVVVLVFSGLPICFALGSCALIIGLLLWGDDVLIVFAHQAVILMRSFLIVAVPCFVFMAKVLETSGMADALYGAAHAWFGHIAGGLAAGTVVICTIFAAMSGMSATATLTMGMIALPAMRKRGYSKSICLGPISAGGALGILIPPSVTFIFYGLVCSVSIGQLFAGGVFAGLLLSAMFIIYILIRCGLRPHEAPPIPPEEMPSFKEKVAKTYSLILPVLLVTGVLGSIFGGIATPTEGAAVGAVGSVVCMIVNRRFTWKRLWQAGAAALRISGMAAYIIIGAKIFASVYIQLQGREVVLTLLAPYMDNPLLLMVIFQSVFFILGMVMDPSATLFIFAPIFAPIVAAVGWDPVWFGVLFVINVEMALLTPPYGFNLFYIHAVVPQDISLGDIYHSI